MGRKPGETSSESLEDLIEAVRTRRLRVNNLFQIGDHWRANLTDGHEYWDFAEGKSAAEALKAALEKVRRKRR
jgi:hypothetical protein